MVTVENSRKERLSEEDRKKKKDQQTGEERERDRKWRVSDRLSLSATNCRVQDSQESHTAIAFILW